jgi:hypothetical protein
MSEGCGCCLSDDQPVRDCVSGALTAEYTTYYFRFDGAALPPAYDAPRCSGPELTTEEGEEVYRGSCHCGAIALAVRTRPLSEVNITECQCTRCAAVRQYPRRLTSTI